MIPRLCSWARRQLRILEQTTDHPDRTVLTFKDRALTLTSVGAVTLTGKAVTTIQSHTGGNAGNQPGSVACSRSRARWGLWRA